MMIKYNIELEKETFDNSIKRITNQIFRLLPLREEGGDWVSPLQNLIVEIAGIERLFNNQLSFFILLSKMEGMLTLTEEDDFPIFRKNIFECLTLLTSLKDTLGGK